MTLACPARLVELPCSMQGYAYLANPLRRDGVELQLMRGHGRHFPVLTGSEFFFVKVEGCEGCCESMKVVATRGDVLVVERPDTGCDCINSNARVSYDYTSKRYIQAAAREIGLNVTGPLVYDCETNTLSVDCNKLFSDPDCGCGSATPPAGGGMRGPIGPEGRPGKDAIGIESMSLEGNVLTWQDSTGRRHTAGTIEPPPGQKGDRGDVGPAGPAGPPGPRGADAGSITMAEQDGQFTLTLRTDDGTERVLGKWTPPRGIGIKDMNIDENSGKLLVTLTDESKLDAGLARGPVGPIGSFDMTQYGNQLAVCGPPGATFTFAIQNHLVNNTNRGPHQLNQEGLWVGNKPHILAEAQLVKVMYNRLVVAVGSV